MPRGSAPGSSDLLALAQVVPHALVHDVPPVVVALTGTDTASAQGDGDPEKTCALIGDRFYAGVQFDLSVGAAPDNQATLTMVAQATGEEFRFQVSSDGTPSRRGLADGVYSATWLLGSTGETGDCGTTVVDSSIWSCAGTSDGFRIVVTSEPQWLGLTGATGFVIDGLPTGNQTSAGPGDIYSEVAPPPGAYQLGLRDTTQGFDLDCGTVLVPALPAPVIDDAGIGDFIRIPIEFNRLNLVFTATGAGGEDVPVICDPPRGTALPLGDTIVTCTATDTRGQSSSKIVTVQVVEELPIFDEVQDIDVDAVSFRTVVRYDEPVAVGVLDEPLDVTCSPTSGSEYPLGTTTVTCSATDELGQTGETSFDITVVDRTGPAIALPADIEVDAAGAAGSQVNYLPPSASDSVDLEVPVACVPAPGTVFPIGQTTVTCTASDSAGNESMVDFDVIVADNDGPVIDATEDISAEATTSDGATVDYDLPTAIDAVDGEVTVVCDPAPGSVFPAGPSTTVRCDAFDLSGNRSTTRFFVTVADTTGPALSFDDGAPADAEATGPDGVTQDFSLLVSATDAVDGDVPVQCAAIVDERPPGPNMYPLGTSAVICTATDSSGNTGELAFDFTVVDTTAPALDLPAGLQLPLNDEPVLLTVGEAPVIVSASDLVDDEVPVLCDLADNTPAIVGDLVVNCSATDNAGNVSNGSFTVTGIDESLPTISDVDDIMAEATGPLGAVVEFANPAAADTYDPQVDVSCTRTFGDTYSIGDTTITCTATDDAGNQATTTFTITVADTTAPGIDTPALVENGTSGDSAAVDFEVSAIDAVDGTVATICTPASGSTFPVGSTIVACTATDAAGNQASDSFEVVVTRDVTTFESLIDRLNDLADDAGGAEARNLRRAVADIEAAQAWVNAGNPYFAMFRLNYALSDIARADRAGLDNATADELEAALGELGGVVTQNAIDEAVADGGNQFRINIAQSQADAAQAALDSGDVSRALRIQRTASFWALIA